MNKLLLSALLALTSVAAAARSYEVGMSISFFTGKDIPSQEQLQSVKDAGIEWIEVVLNPLSSRYCPENEVYPRAFRLKARIEAAGLKVWSCHLPYGKTLDVSNTDPGKREKVLQEDERLIGLASIFTPHVLVLHPSAEPINDADRAERLKCARNSIGRLSLAAARIGATLCVEDLPRTCLGNCSEELMYLIEPYPDVMICFDTNHLLRETHAHFFQVVGSRIGTIHASDYDRVDERHWIEGAGVVDWKEFSALLKASGYKGVFMHEVRSGENVSPAAILEAYDKVVK